MKSNFIVTYKITGEACAYVNADSMEEAVKKANALDIYDDELIEWSFDDVKAVREECSLDCAFDGVPELKNEEG